MFEFLRSKPNRPASPTTIRQLGDVVTDFVGRSPVHDTIRGSTHMTPRDDLMSEYPSVPGSVGEEQIGSGLHTTLPGRSTAYMPELRSNTEKQYVTASYQPVFGHDEHIAGQAASVLYYQKETEDFGTPARRIDRHVVFVSTTTMPKAELVIADYDHLDDSNYPALRKSKLTEQAARAIIDDLSGGELMCWVLDENV